MSLITCQNVSLSYNGQAVVKNLTFSVEESECLCIIGENGSGKSTLVKALLGLKRPSEGKITYGKGLSNNKIGYLPQKNETQSDFPATAREIVLSGCLSNHKFLPFYNSDDKKNASGNMRKLGIENLADKPFSELSGGQRQRVLLARALCATKTLLLLDEPVASLDPATTAEFYEILASIRKSGITVVMVSHDVESALAYADRVLCLNKNHNFIGTPAEHEAHKSASHSKVEVDN